MAHLISVVVPTPAHSRLSGTLSYRSEAPLAPGTLVRVPLGAREILGVVWPSAPGTADPLSEDELKPVTSVMDGIAPLCANWRHLIAFTASYYQRSLGEVALAALPPQMRELNPEQMLRRIKRVDATEQGAFSASDAQWHVLNAEQQDALAQIDSASGPFLLFGATGSGKTEVYLRAVQAALARDPQAQALVMVPEINLTPQLEQRFIERFGSATVVSLHSGMSPSARLRSWLAAHSGNARILLGTRMGVLASIPHLRLIVVDEEHDASYKAQDGARHSARDLALYRGKHGKAKVILGSATPSVESWHASERGRSQRLTLANRIAQAQMPEVRMVDLNQLPRKTLLSPTLVDAIAQRVARGEQSLIFLNRRGYAPVLACSACEWKSECAHCSAYRVFHKLDRTLRCHHCGFTERVPRGCPLCGNIDIAPVGRGTERIEEHLAELTAHVLRPGGEPLRIRRMDADTTRLKGSLETQLASVHAGEVDVLVGTQMITKGHDFRRITLVAAVNADAALFSNDFRAPERLFALLMQAAGRAGRDASHAGKSEMLVQTHHPNHPLFASLRKYDFAGFAARQLRERQAATMPPFGAQALARAEARSQEAAQGFLNEARELARSIAHFEHVQVYPCVPMSMQRIANVERAQMLVESASRAALQAFLTAWRSELVGMRKKGVIRWAVDVDPLAI